MDTASLSGVIVTSSSGTDEPPCWVQQQQDTEKTVPCSGTGEMLNMLFRDMGIVIPYPEETETYSTSISIKPKNIYTSLNISLTHGSLSSPTYTQGISSQKFSVSTGDFLLSGEKYILDPRTKIDLVESDSIISATWNGTPVDDELVTIPLTQQTLTVIDNKIQSTAPGNGVMVIKYNELSIKYDVEIAPREDADEGFYNTHLVIDPEGCEGAPSFYNIKVPDCYEINQLLKNVIPGSGGQAVDFDTPSDRLPPPPKGGESYECEYCLCNPGKLKSGDEKMCPSTDQDGENNCSTKDC